MHLRRLTGSDAEVYRRLRLEGLRTAPTAFGSSYEESVERPLTDYARRLEPSERTVVMGAFEGDELVGTVGVFQEAGLKERHKAVLWGVYVTPSARGAGVAKALTRAVIDAARAMEGVRQIKLAVEGTNHAARALYESLGFTEFGREERALCVDGVFYAEVHMVLFLDEAKA